VPFPARVSTHDSGQDRGPTSTTYPAPHPAMPQIPRNGGVVLRHPSVVTVTFAGDPLQDKIEAFADQVVGLDWWSTVNADYGVGAAESAARVVIPKAPAAAIGDADLERWLAARIGDGTLPAPTDQTVYALYYPQTTTVTLGDAEGGGASCSTFLGYHTTVDVAVAGKTVHVAYAVINQCGGGLDELTVTASHELTEAATDPHPVDASTAGYVILDDGPWTGLGGEDADMCAGVSSAAEAGFALTRVWNNRAAAAGDQPCLPVPGEGRGPFFDAGIVRERLVAHLGGSASTEVDCYAFGALPSRIRLKAQADEQAPLSLSFDHKTCTNGDKVTLTVSLRSGAQRGADYHYTLLAGLDGGGTGGAGDAGPGSAAHVWRGMVHVQ
jgi:hypothetical protein